MMYTSPMAGVKKGEKRSWVAGKPKFTNGELRRVTLLLSDKQIQFLHHQGNVSATVRRLIDTEMARSQKRERK
jgi:intergrase/recombinase